jgi:hypothetical protein
MHIGYWWERQKERDYYEAQDVGGWVDKTKMGLRDTEWDGMDRINSGSGQGPVEGSCEHGNESSGSIKC